MAANTGWLLNGLDLICPRKQNCRGAGKGAILINVTSVQQLHQNGFKAVGCFKYSSERPN